MHPITEELASASADQRASFLGTRDRPLVMYVIQHRDASGAEIMQLPLLAADADPLVACPPDGSTRALLERHGFPTVPVRFRTLRWSGGLRETLLSVPRGLWAARELRQVLREHPDRTIICCATIRGGLVAAFATMGLRRRALWVVTDFLPPEPLRSLIRLLARSRCAVAAPSSAALARDFAGRSRALRRRTCIAYPGVDTKRYLGVRPQAGAPRAAIVGHISATKQTHLAIEVARRVGAAHPGFRLEVAGRAQYREEDFAYERDLMNQVERDGRLRDVIRFRGQTTDVPALLAECGLLLHARPDEPFGIALIEAMALGLPVVAPDACGPAEIVEHGVTGLLYEPGDVAQAAAHVLRLIGHPEEARRLGAAGRERVARLFSVDEQVRRFDAMLARVSLTAPPSQRRAGTSESGS
jgi:glycosyltransferase involved in cell wall biosynthesis